MDETTREDLGKKSWEIDEYHRGIKQFCGVEKCFRKNILLSSKKDRKS